MRVLFISDVYFPRINGVSTSLRTFRHDLAACDVDTTLVAPDYGSADPGDDAEVIRVPSAGVPGDPEDRRMRWGALRRALERAGASKPDLVHIQTPFIAHYAGVRFARRQRIPCVATYHTFFEEYLHHYVPVLPRGIGRFIARHFTRSQCLDLDALIAPSDPMRDLLVKYDIATPIHVIPTGLPADRFRRGDGASFRKTIGVEADRPLVTYVGRVAHEKNIAFLIRMFIELQRHVPQALLVIAGEGPARDSLRQLVKQLSIEHAVRFVGYLDRNTALLDCYAAANVFVFASRTETQGLVLLEAMAQGTPVVSIAELGTRSILRTGLGALIVEEEKSAFAAAVVRVLTDASLHRMLSEQGAAYALEWSSLAMARRMADFYRQIVSTARDSVATEPPSRRAASSHVGQ